MYDTIKSREHYYNTQNDSFVMAAKAYANDNRNVLPKNIGGSSKILLKTLRDSKYLKEDDINDYEYESRDDND